MWGIFSLTPSPFALRPHQPPPPITEHRKPNTASGTLVLFVPYLHDILHIFHYNRIPYSNNGPKGDSMLPFLISSRKSLIVNRKSSLNCSSVVPKTISIYHLSFLPSYKALSPAKIVLQKRPFFSHFPTHFWQINSSPNVSLFPSDTHPRSTWHWNTWHPLTLQSPSSMFFLRGPSCTSC